MAPRKSTAQTRQIRISAVNREWDPLFAYAESMQIPANQAAAELLLASLTSNAASATFIATARRSRHEIHKLMLTEALRSIGEMWKRIAARAVELGIDLDDPMKG